MTEVSIASPIEIKKFEEKVILDIRTFVPCHAKESEEWSWHKLKNEKWFIHLTKQHRLRKWKLS